MTDVATVSLWNFCQSGRNKSLYVCDVLQGLALLIYYIALYISSFASWSILDVVFVVSASVFFHRDYNYKPQAR